MKRASLVNLSVLLVSFVLCFALLETACRIFFEAPPSVVIENLPEKQKNARPPGGGDPDAPGRNDIVSAGTPDRGFYVNTPTGRRLRKGVSGKVELHRLSKRDVEISTNSLGYRYDEIGEKTDRDYRILVLGDSITLADYVPVDQTYPAIVERILNDPGTPNRDGRNIQVINAGVGAIDLQNEFAILMETGLSVEPDVVLVGLYLNDAFHSPVLEVRKLSSWLSWSHLARMVSWRLDVLREQYDYENAELLDKDALEIERERYLAEHPVKQGHRQTRRDWVTSREAVDFRIANSLRDWGYAWTDDFWQRVVPTLELMKQVGRDEGFRLAVLLFPVRLQVQSELTIDEPQREFERRMKELGVPHLDLLPLLREKYQRDGEEVFYDHCHYRPEGYAYLASAMAEFLIGEVISE